MSFKNFICIIMSFKIKRNNVTRVISWWMHLSCHTFYPHLWIVFVKLSKSVSRRDNDSHMLPIASAFRPKSSLLPSLFVGSGICSLRLGGNDSARGSSSPSVASLFIRHIQSFHTSTERSKLFKLSRCPLSADSSLSPCESTSSKYCCISCCCFWWWLLLLSLLEK